MKSKKLVLNRETVRALSVQEMQGVAGGFSAMTSIIVLQSRGCGNGTGTGGGGGNGTGWCSNRCVVAK